MVEAPVAVIQVAIAEVVNHTVAANVVPKCPMVVDMAVAEPREAAEVVTEVEAVPVTRVVTAEVVDRMAVENVWAAMGESQWATAEDMESKL